MRRAPRRDGREAALAWRYHVEWRCTGWSAATASTERSQPRAQRRGSARAREEVASIEPDADPRRGWLLSRAFASTAALPARVRGVDSVRRGARAAAGCGRSHVCRSEAVLEIESRPARHCRYLDASRRSNALAPTWTRRPIFQRSSKPCCASARNGASPAGGVRDRAHRLLDRVAALHYRAARDARVRAPVDTPRAPCSAAARSAPILAADAKAAAACSSHTRAASEGGSSTSASGPKPSTNRSTSSGAPTSSSSTTPTIHRAGRGRVRRHSSITMKLGRAHESLVRAARSPSITLDGLIERKITHRAREAQIIVSVDHDRTAIGARMRDHDARRLRAAQGQSASRRGLRASPRSVTS